MLSSPATHFSKFGTTEARIDEALYLIMNLLRELLCLNPRELVKIDYNVLFEKFKVKIKNHF